MNPLLRPLRAGLNPAVFLESHPMPATRRPLFGIDRGKRDAIQTEGYQALLRGLRGQKELPESGLLLGIVRDRSCRGGSAVSVNLAAAFLSATQARTLLVAASPRNRLTAEAFRLKSQSGLYDYLAGTAQLETIAHSLADPLWHFIPPGKLPRATSRDAVVERFRQALPVWREQFRTVIVDLPPIAAATFCLDFAPALDGVVLEVQADRLDRVIGKQTIDALRSVGTRVLGCVYKG